MNAKITAFGAFQMYSSTFEEEWMTGGGGGQGVTPQLKSRWKEKKKEEIPFLIFLQMIKWYNEQKWKWNVCGG